MTNLTPLQNLFYPPAVQQQYQAMGQQFPPNALVVQPPQNIQVVPAGYANPVGHQVQNPYNLRPRVPINYQEPSSHSSNFGSFPAQNSGQNFSENDPIGHSTPIQNQIQVGERQNLYPIIPQMESPHISYSIPIQNHGQIDSGHGNGTANTGQNLGLPQIPGQPPNPNVNQNLGNQNPNIGNPNVVQPNEQYFPLGMGHNPNVFVPFHYGVQIQNPVPQPQYVAIQNPVQQPQVIANPQIGGQSNLEKQMANLIQIQIADRYANVSNNLKSLSGTEGRDRILDFFSQLDLLTDGWEDSKKVNLLRAKAKDKAKRTFSAAIKKFGEGAPYNTIRVEMIEKLRETDTKETTSFIELQQFSTRKPDEDVVKFGEKIQRLVVCAHPGLDEEQLDKLMQMYFVSNINDSDLARFLQMRSKEVQSFDELIMLANRLDKVDPSKIRTQLGAKSKSSSGEAQNNQPQSQPQNSQRPRNQFNSRNGPNFNRNNWNGSNPNQNNWNDHGNGPNQNFQSSSQFQGNSQRFWQNPNSNQGFQNSNQNYNTGSQNSNQNWNSEFQNQNWNSNTNPTPSSQQNYGTYPPQHTTGGNQTPLNQGRTFGNQKPKAQNAPLIACEPEETENDPAHTIQLGCMGSSNVSEAVKFFRAVGHKAKQMNSGKNIPPLLSTCRTIPVQVFGKGTQALLDSGAEANVINPNFLYEAVRDGNVNLEEWDFCLNDGDDGLPFEMASLGGSRISILGSVNIPVVWGRVSRMISFILPREEIGYEMVFGTVALSQLGFYMGNSLTGQKISFPAPAHRSNHAIPRLHTVRIADFHAIPPYSSRHDNSFIDGNNNEHFLVETGQKMSDLQNQEKGDDFGKVFAGSIKQMAAESNTDSAKSSKQAAEKGKTGSVETSVALAESFESVRAIDIFAPSTILRGKFQIWGDSAAKMLSAKLNGTLNFRKTSVELAELLSNAAIDPLTEEVIIFLGQDDLISGTNLEAAKKSVEAMVEKLKEFKTKVLWVPPPYNHDLAEKHEAYLRMLTEVVPLVGQIELVLTKGWRSYPELFRFGSGYDGYRVTRGGELKRLGATAVALFLQSVFDMKTPIQENEKADIQKVANENSVPSSPKEKVPQVSAKPPMPAKTIPPAKKIPSAFPFPPPRVAPGSSNSQQWVPPHSHGQKRRGGPVGRGNFGSHRPFMGPKRGRF